MIAMIVSIDVKPEAVEPFIDATLANARSTRTEPGNLRFDVLRALDNPNQFTLYEVYISDDAIAAHRASAHYQQWAIAVEPLLAAPRTRVWVAPLFYGDAVV